MLDRIDSMRRKFGIEEMIFIGDRGMLTRARRNDLTAEEYKNKIYYRLGTQGVPEVVEDDKHPLHCRCSTAKSWSK